MYPFIYLDLSGQFMNI